MDQKVRGLIDHCIQLQQELALLTPVMLFLNPWHFEEAGIRQVPSRGRLKFRERWKVLGGWDRVKIEYALQEKELEKGLCELAEALEEEGFEIENFKSRITQDQFSWLLSQKGNIKKHLRGIDLAGYGG